MMIGQLTAWPWGRIVRHVVSSLILFVTLYLAVMDKTASATVMAGLFIVTHLLTNIDKLKSFAAFGVNAELREVIREAQLTIDQARQMALTSASQTFYQYAVQGRLLGADWRRKNELVRKLNTNLQDVGVDPKEIKEARREMFEFAQYDMISTCQNHINERILANGAPRENLPAMVTYAGEDLNAFDKLTDLISTHDALNASDRQELLSEARRFREALRQSMEAGLFTDEALGILDE